MAASLRKMLKGGKTIDQADMVLARSSRTCALAKLSGSSGSSSWRDIGSRREE